MDNEFEGWLKPSALEKVLAIGIGPIISLISIPLFKDSEPSLQIGSYMSGLSISFLTLVNYARRSIMYTYRNNKQILNQL